MLKNWPTPLLGTRAHCSYSRLSVELGCSAVSVSESDQETPLFYQADCCQFLFFKTIFISLRILHQNCSPGRINEFGLSNRLISISGAQDILVWISDVKVENSAASRILTRVALKTLLPSQFCWLFFLGYTLSHIGMLNIH